MITRKNKIIIMFFLALFLFFVQGVNVVNAKKNVTFSNSGCGNFNVGGKHYGGDQRCAVLHIDCPPPPPPPPPPPVHGVCGSANEGFDVKTGIFSPTENCASGDVSSRAWNHTPGVSGRLTWNCNGRNGGRDVSCTWNTPPKNGQCNSVIDGNIINFTINQSEWSRMCSSGPQKNLVSNLSNYTWSCAGTYGGSDASCKAEKLPQFGRCGDLFNSNSNTVLDLLPTNPSLLCYRGELKNKLEDEDKYTWICSGIGGAPDSGLCIAKKPKDELPVTTDLTKIENSTSTKIIPVTITELTVSAKIIPIADKGKYCTLTDLQYTTNPGADTSNVLCNVYQVAGKKSPQKYSDQDAVKQGYQVSPGYQYYFGCGIFNLDTEKQTKFEKSKTMWCYLNPSVKEI
jgi:hypothetical protein